MEIFTYNRGDYKRAFDSAQWVFFTIDTESVEIINGIGKYNHKDNTINIYEYDLNNNYVGGKLKNHENIRKNINDVNELNYIGRPYIKIYGSVDKINENEGEIVDYFDTYIKSSIVRKYAEKFLKLKNNKWTLRILSKLPAPSRYTKETLKNTLNKLENKILNNEIDNQTFKKEWKFWIPTLISISSILIAFTSLIISIFKP